MCHNRWFMCRCLPLLAVACLAGPASGVITKLTPLAGIIADSDDIVIAKVDAVDPARPSMVLIVERRLKGESTTKRYPINLKGDAEGDAKHVLDRVEKGTLLVLFVTDLGQRRQALAFTEGSWFQIMGVPDGESVRWGFTHAEPYLRRTFIGTTAQLEKVVTDVIAGQAAAPDPMPKEKGGLGPKLDGTIEPWTADPGGESPAKVPAADPTPAVTPSASKPAEKSEAGGDMTKYLGIAVIGVGVVLVIALVIRKKQSAAGR